MWLKIVRGSNPEWHFHSSRYLRDNSRRLEHLASLRIPVAGMSVLEVGAGIGDLSHYFIDRGCNITITEARYKNLKYLKNRYPKCDVKFLNMENPSSVTGYPFDIVFCYGLLHHLSNPAQAITFMSQQTGKILFLETCVSFGEKGKINLTNELKSNPTQAFSGIGCRPARSWVFNQIKRHFEYVYLPKTQPNNKEFPIDWTTHKKHKPDCQRAIFIASREPIENEMLTSSLIMKQTRHE